MYFLLKKTPYSLCLPPLLKNTWAVACISIKCINVVLYEEFDTSSGSLSISGHPSYGSQCNDTIAENEAQSIHDMINQPSSTKLPTKIREGTWIFLSSKMYYNYFMFAMSNDCNLYISKVLITFVFILLPHLVQKGLNLDILKCSATILCLQCPIIAICIIQKSLSLLFLFCYTV